MVAFISGLFNSVTGIAFFIGMLGFGILATAAWIQHVYTCIEQEIYWLLVVGFIIPIGSFHGLGIWLGWWSQGGVMISEWIQ